MMRLYHIFYLETWCLYFLLQINAIYCEAKGYVRRGVGIPVTENVIKGPREGFTEAFVDNVSLITTKNKKFKFEI